jgi:hypothetical protein
MNIDAAQTSSTDLSGTRKSPGSVVPIRRHHRLYALATKRFPERWLMALGLFAWCPCILVLVFHSWQLGLAPLGVVALLSWLPGHRGLPDWMLAKPESPVNSEDFGQSLAA